MFPGYRMVFSDTFSGPTLNTKAWGVYNGPGNSHGPRSAQNTFVSNGMLVLRTTKINGVWYGAGVSAAKANIQTYGRYLVRLRFAKGYGVRAVALLWPQAKMWPPEVDFFETPATIANRDMTTMTNHYGPGNNMQRAKVTADFTQWHTVGVDWTPTSITYTLDGVTTATMTGHVPQQPMWLGIQTALGGPTDQPNITTPPNVDLNIDWVAIYQPAN